MPVHELQIPNIASKFRDAEILHPDISLQALAQPSIRFASHSRSCIIILSYLIPQDRPYPQTPWTISQIGRWG